MINFRKILLDGRVSQLQDNVEQAFLAANSEPFIRGTILTDVVVTTSATRIPTKLRSLLTGWVVIDRNADARVWRAAANELGFLTLQASATVTVSLWVF